VFFLWVVSRTTQVNAVDLSVRVYPVGPAGSARAGRTASASRASGR
jgi:hypothetical protein